MRQPRTWLRKAKNRLGRRFSASGTDDQMRTEIGMVGIAALRAGRPYMRDLWEAELSVFSQWGEDGILSLLCDSLELTRPRVLELGAGNFSECNSRFLAEARCASVMAVDARTDLSSSIHSSNIGWRSTIIARETWITPATAALLSAEARREFAGLDIVSIDLDGNDFWVLKSLDLSDVQVVVAEYNAAFGPARAVTVPQDDHFDRVTKHWSWLYYGASLRAYSIMLAEKGFVLVGTNRACNNAFFVKESSADSVGFAARNDWTSYCDVRFREGRTHSQQLALVHPQKLLRQASTLPLVDIESGSPCTVGDVIGPE